MGWKLESIWACDLLWIFEDLSARRVKKKMTPMKCRKCRKKCRRTAAVDDVVVYSCFMLFPFVSWADLVVMVIVSSVSNCRNSIGPNDQLQDSGSRVHWCPPAILSFHESFHMTFHIIPIIPIIHIHTSDAWGKRMVMFDQCHHQGTTSGDQNSNMFVDLARHPRRLDMCGLAQHVISTVILWFFWSPNLSEACSFKKFFWVFWIVLFIGRTVELHAVRCSGITIRGAWTSPGRKDTLFHHAVAVQRSSSLRSNVHQKCCSCASLCPKYLGVAVLTHKPAAHWQRALFNSNSWSFRRGPDARKAAFAQFWRETVETALCWYLHQGQISVANRKLMYSTRSNTHTEYRLFLMCWILYFWKMFWK